MIERFGKCIFQRTEIKELFTLNNYNDHNLIIFDCYNKTIYEFCQLN